MCHPIDQRSTFMQYLLLIYSDEKAGADMPKEAMDAWMGEYMMTSWPSRSLSVS